MATSDNANANPDDLADFVDEPIHIPGTIQPQGVLLVLDPQSLRIVQCSANSADLLARPAAELPGCTLETFFDPPTLERLQHFSQSWPDAEFPILLFSALIPTSQTRVDATVHHNGAVLLLELEPGPPPSPDLYRQVDHAVAVIQTAADMATLLERIAREIQSLTGYDRVMIYKFLPDDSGEVVAEVARAGLEPFLGLRYPATDIPPLARRLYLQNRLRIIADVDYQPVPLVPPDASDGRAPLDMGMAVLRSVSPIHIEYLQNMGVRATMTISLLRDDRLWGMIACHHYSGPHSVHADLRVASATMGRIAALQIAAYGALANNQQRQQIDRVVKHWLSATADTDDVLETINRGLPELLALFEASAAALFLDGQHSSLGRLPPRSWLEDLRHWLHTRMTTPVYHSHHLAQDFPAAHAYLELASGLLAMQLPSGAEDYLLLFRPELIQTVTWGGDPQKAVIVHDDGRRLSPRKSFAAWSETVAETAQPWEPALLDAAIEIQASLSTGWNVTRRKRFEQALLEREAALRKAKEAAEAADRAKTAFLANMSHEIRTPLNAVIGMANLLQDTTLTNDQLEFVDTIRAGGDALLALVNDVLDISKIEAGHLELDEQAFDLHSCLEEAFQLGAHQARDAGLELSFDLDPALPAMVIGDVTRLRQIIVNLLTNAVKFTEKGRVTLSAQSRSLEAGRHEIMIQVQDSGIGIATVDQERIFRAFTQVDSSSTRPYGGTGLGLAISRQIVELMGGRLSVASSLGKGATFTVMVPMRSVDRVAAPWQGLQPAFQGKLVLVVDDIPANRRLLSVQLEHWGMQVTLCDNGRSAISMVNQGYRPDVVLMDLQMPELDGISTTRVLRGFPQMAEVPCLLLSSSERQLPAGDRALFAGLLTRPIKRAHLGAALLALLDELPPAPAPGPARPPQVAPAIRPLRILVAEDNPVNQQVIRRLLNRQQHLVDVVRNGYEALMAVGEQTYDVIMMDIQMPELDGVAATRQIRALGERIRQPHIIALTAHALIDDRERYLAAGMDAYLSKPIQVAALNKVLAAAASQVDTVMESEDCPNTRSSAIDWTVLENLLISLEDEGPATVAEMIQLFEQETGQQIAMLDAAIRADDREQLRLLAHRVRGGASQLGAVRVVEVCQLLESRSVTAAPAELDHLQRRLHAAYQEALCLLQERWPD